MISGCFIRHSLFILCAVGRGCRAGWVRCVWWRSPRWLRLAACCVHLQFPGEVFCVCVCVCWGTRASGGGREGGREGSRWHVAEVVGGRVFPPGANQQCQTPPPRTHTGTLLSLPGLSGRLSSAGDVSSPRASCVCFGFFLQDVCFTAAKLET